MPASPSVRVTADLLRKYDRPGPRYTSYPTAVEFNESFTAAQYAATLDRAAARPDEALSLYVHLPFCEERCAFCGCLVIATRRREVAARYLAYLNGELDLLAARLRERRRVVQCHWGGGTPTYLTTAQMTALQTAVRRHFVFDRDAELGIEVDPRVTTIEQLDLLRALGFNRLSMGVQDFTPAVQAAIGRHQNEAGTRRLFAAARAVGFGSINIDLVYGLPGQTLDGFDRTLTSVIEMAPDRVAVYSYAHVPWLRPNQRLIDPQLLPSPELKIELFGLAVDAFLGAGYRQIGMDHFALPDDELARAVQGGTLTRNFMGYTTRRAGDMVGIGLSAIGDVAGAYAQNTRKLSAYFRALDEGRFPIERGLMLDPDDLVRRHVITELMCNFAVSYAEVERRFGIDFGDYFSAELSELDKGPVRHGFVRIDPDRIVVTAEGRLFVRNVCMVFDCYLRRQAAGRPTFSRTV